MPPLPITPQRSGSAMPGSLSHHRGRAHLVHCARVSADAATRAWTAAACSSPAAARGSARRSSAASSATAPGSLFDSTCGGALEEPGPGVQFVACDLTDVEALRAAVASIEPARRRAHQQRRQRPALRDRRDHGRAVGRLAGRQPPPPVLHGAGGRARHARRRRRRDRQPVLRRLAAGHQELVPYATAKAGVLGLTNSLATALGPDRIRVNAIAPGAVMTPRQMAPVAQPGEPRPDRRPAGDPGRRHGARRRCRRPVPRRRRLQHDHASVPVRGRRHALMPPAAPL